MHDLRTVSVIIPAYNDEVQLRQMLKRLHAIREREYAALEIVVAARASKDNTVAVAREMADVVVDGGSVTEARNAGAHAAKGEVLVFVDADSLPNFGVIPRIAEMVTEKTVGTCPAYPSLDTPKAQIAVAVANFARRTKLIRGMTNLFFCHRSLFAHEGIGYNEERNIGEFSEHIWRARRKAGARYTYLNIPDCYQFSVDRWERVGYFKSLRFWAKFALFVYVLKRNPKHLEEEYWSQ